MTFLSRVGSGLLVGVGFIFAMPVNRAASTNQNVTNSILRERPFGWPPWLARTEATERNAGGFQTKSSNLRRTFSADERYQSAAFK